MANRRIHTGSISHWRDAPRDCWADYVYANTRADEAKKRAEKAERERDEARRAAEWWRDQQREIDIYESPDDYRLPWEEGDRDE